MNNKPLVLYHAECQDGFTAAWCAWRHMPNAEFVPVQYGQDPPEVKGRDLYILDFSYKRSVLEKMVDVCASMVLLDHHQTAQADLEPVGAWPTHTHFVFDMKKSGARLAWEHFFPEQDPPFLIDLVQDRDLWQWKLPFSKELNTWLASLERTFEEWDDIAATLSRPFWVKDYSLSTGEPVSGHWQLRDGYTESAVMQGSAILRYEAQQVASICKHAREIEIAGHKVLAVNTSTLFSEVAGKLAEDRPFGAAWFIRADGKKQWSLRSRDSGVSVAEVAKQFGGGGHFSSAGFTGEVS